MIIKTKNLSTFIKYILFLATTCLFIISCNDIIVEADNLQTNNENVTENNNNNLDVATNNNNQTTNTNVSLNNNQVANTNNINANNNVDSSNSNDLHENTVNSESNSSHNNSSNDENNSFFNNENSFFNNDENSFFNSWFDDENENENHDYYEDIELGIKVILKWNNLEKELSLHLVKNNGELGSEDNDCFKENPHPEWETDGEDEYGPNYIGSYINNNNKYSLIHFADPSPGNYTIFVTNNLNGSIEDNIDINGLDDLEIEAEIMVFIDDDFINNFKVQLEIYEQIWKVATINRSEDDYNYNITEHNQTFETEDIMNFHDDDEEEDDNDHSGAENGN